MLLNFIVQAYIIAFLDINLFCFPTRMFTNNLVSSCKQINTFDLSITLYESQKCIKEK